MLFLQNLITTDGGYTTLVYIPPSVCSKTKYTDKFKVLHMRKT